jgi:hypothetical protein
MGSHQVLEGDKVSEALAEIDDALGIERKGA